MTLKPGINKIEYFSRIDGKPEPGVAKIYLSDMTGQKPAGVSFANNEAEHQAWAAAYEAKFATVTNSRIYIKTIPSQLAYNVKEITVRAVTDYQFIFENPDHMLHNLVITKPGKATAVGEMADAMAAQADALLRHYVPDTGGYPFLDTTNSFRRKDRFTIYYSKRAGEVSLHLHLSGPLANLWQE